MAWSNPRTWVAGEQVTASLMNTYVRDEFAYLKDSPTFDGSVTITNDLAVGDDTTITGDLAVTGTLTVAGQEVGTARATVCGRLTLTTALPVTVSDVTAATTVFFALYKGNQIALYNGTGWLTFSIAQLSIAVPSTTNTGYDVFVDYNAGTPVLSLLVWTNLTTRATALTLQDGVLVLTGSTGKRYVGSFRTTGVSGQTEDSGTKRYVWNYYNRDQRPLLRTDATTSWTYTTATIRQANAAAANQVEVFVGVQEATMELKLRAAVKNDIGVSFTSGIGRDSTSTYVDAGQGASSSILSIPAFVNEKPAIGSHTYSWNEWSAAAGTTTFYGTQGDSTPAGTASGLRGWIEG